MSSLQPVRGTHDILPEEMRKHRRVIDTARVVAERYGYLEAQTPIFEFSDVFKRTLGDTSDIVTKEMYSFTDRGGEQLTLRPEGTASFARALISEGLSQDLPLKYFYHGPMFRYERPQKGRMRQFHQTGVELLGVAQPQGDVEIIAVGAAILRALGAARPHRAGVEYARRWRQPPGLPQGAGGLSRRSQIEACRRTASTAWSAIRCACSTRRSKAIRRWWPNAPLYSDHLNDASRAFFDAVKSGLDALGIATRSTPAGARARLLLPHLLRVHGAGTWGAEDSNGRRPIRWPRRDDGRPGDAGRGLGLRYRARGHDAGRGQ